MLPAGKDTVGSLGARSIAPGCRIVACCGTPYLQRTPQGMTCIGLLGYCVFRCIPLTYLCHGPKIGSIGSWPLQPPMKHERICSRCKTGTRPVDRLVGSFDLVDSTFDLTWRNLAVLKCNKLASIFPAQSNRTTFRLISKVSTLKLQKSGLNHHS